MHSEASIVFNDLKREQEEESRRQISAVAGIQAAGGKSRAGHDSSILNPSTRQRLAEFLRNG
jgi:hypothetical protein